jgi:hypothetical protein
VAHRFSKAASSDKINRLTLGRGKIVEDQAAIANAFLDHIRFIACESTDWINAHANRE